MTLTDSSSRHHNTDKRRPARRGPFNQELWPGREKDQVERETYPRVKEKIFTLANGFLSF